MHGCIVLLGICDQCVNLRFPAYCRREERTFATWFPQTYNHKYQVWLRPLSHQNLHRRSYKGAIALFFLYRRKWWWLRCLDFGGQAEEEYSRWTMVNCILAANFYIYLRYTRWMNFVHIINTLTSYAARKLFRTLLSLNKQLPSC